MTELNGAAPAAPVLAYTAMDMSNHLLVPGKSVMTTAVITRPGYGELLMVTIRTGSSTLTVFLDKQESNAWGDQLKRDGNRLPEEAADEPPLPDG